MVFDLRHAGEARVSMKGFVDDLLQGSEISGVARTPATDGLFEIRDKPPVTEDRRMRFHSLVAKILYLAKRTKPECLTAISFLTTRVTKCTCDDEEKLQRLVRYKNQRSSSRARKDGDRDQDVRGRSIRSTPGQDVAHRELRSDRRQGCSTLQVDQAILHVEIEHRGRADSAIRLC